MVFFSDSVATVRAVTTGSSGAPQINELAIYLRAKTMGIQMVGVHQARVRNGVSESFSRGKVVEVLTAVEEAGLRAECLPLVADWKRILIASQNQPTRDGE